MVEYKLNQYILKTLLLFHPKERKNFYKDKKTPTVSMERNLTKKKKRCLIQNMKENSKKLRRPPKEETNDHLLEYYNLFTQNYY
jgi:hypothetical protein